jgi:hypothetical protein
MPDTSMKKLAAIRILSLSKKPRLASWVEKPASATVEKEWPIASNADMPSR